MGPKAHSDVSGRMERSAAASLCYWVRLHSSKQQIGQSAMRAEISVDDKQIEPPSREMLVCLVCTEYANILPACLLSVQGSLGRWCACFIRLMRCICFNRLISHMDACMHIHIE